MFGKNPIRRQEPDVKDRLWVQEIFDTVQGEGPYTGRKSVFIRLAGCNLRCWFCDTEFESSTWHPKIHEIAERAHALGAGVTTLAVITGGEPFRQNFMSLVDMLNEYGFAVQVETAGTLWLPGVESRFPRFWEAQKHRDTYGQKDVNSIVCSPKTPKIHESLVPYISAWKYVVQAGCLDPIDKLPNASTQSRDRAGRVARPWDYQRITGANVAPIWVQPMDQQNPTLNKANQKAAMASAMAKGYQLGLQLHKILDLP